MSSQIPFYQNLQDNAHCAPAVFKSLIEYFCDEKLDWEEMDVLGRSIDGLGTWTIPFHLKLASNGIDVKLIENFDYNAFARQGREYLESLYEKGQFYLNFSNWENAREEINEFIKLVKPENRSASIAEIDSFLRNEYLVGLELNSRILNNRDGFVLHYVLIKEKIGDEYIINDPGGGTDNGYENRPIDRSLLIKAIGGEYSAYEVAAFRDTRGKDQNRKELVIIVDENDNPISTKARDEIDVNDIIRVSVLWIEDGKGNVLLQQRSHNKKIGPGQWGPAVAGTVESHETYLSNVVKEAEEEIGLLNFTPIEVGKRLYWETDGKFGRIFTFFKTTSKNKAEEFTINTEEVAQLKWVPKKQLLDMVDNKVERYVPRAVLWRELFE